MSHSDPTPTPLQPLPIPAFGRILLERGLANEQDIERCLDIQRRRARAGDFRRLGEILVDEGILDLGQVLEVLGAQRIALLCCPTCSTRYNVLNWDGARRYRCRKCRDLLERPESIRSVSIEDTVDIETLEAEGPIVEWPTPVAGKKQIQEQPQVEGLDFDAEEDLAHLKGLDETPSKPTRRGGGDGASLEVPQRLPESSRLPGLGADLIADEKAHGAPRLGKYEIIGEIGRGGMGVIYKAIHAELNRVVALKVLSPGRDPLPEDIERFRREARAVAQLRHPNIVAIHEVGEVDGVHFFAMDFVEGIPFARMIDKGQMKASEAVEVLTPIADALHYAHSRGVVHRDIKPSNIIVSLDDKPFLVDFGIAKIKSDNVDLTAGHEILGSAPYMAPEYIEGESARYDERCDVYALGVVLYEALTGVRPHEDTDTIRLLRKILYTDPLPLETRRPDIDPRLSSIVETAIARDPVRRYPTALAFANDLRRFRSGEKPQARRRLLPGLRTARAKLLKERSGAVTIVAAAACLVLGGAGSRLLWSSAPEKQEVSRPQMIVDLIADARALEARRDAEGALLTYNFAIQLDPEGNAEAYARRGLLLLIMGREEEGRRDLATANALAPGIVERLRRR